MTREPRQLAASYLIFAVYLVLTTISPDPGIRPVMAGRLVRQTAAPARNRADKPDALLRHLGCRPVSSAGPSWRILPPSAETPRGWRLSCPAGGAWTALERVLKALAGEGWREQRWGLQGGLLRVWLAPTTGGGAPIWLEVPVGSPWAVIPRGDPAPMRPPARRPEPPSARSLPVEGGKPASRGPRAAIIVDDVGVVPGAEGFLALPAPLTFAVLPFTPHAGEFLRHSAAAGRAVILHLPLEPLDEAADPGPGTIPTRASPDEILARLEADLRAVPGAIGVNNHMGSRGTSDKRLMTTILTALRERGLFFIDSRTWRGSVAGDVARAIGVRHAVRDVFLDPDGATAAEIRRLLRELIALAKENGSAIGICHANRPNTLAALAAALPDFAAAGVEIVPVDELVHE